MTDLVPLSKAHCIPRRGSEHRLSDAQVRELLPQVPEWSLSDEGKAITRTFRFDDYYRTMAFVNALALIAHQQDHHPDLEVGYNRCQVSLNTHDVGGISETDIDCARRIDALLS